MMVITMFGIPGTDKEKLKRLYRDYMAMISKIRELDLTGQRMIFYFPSDMLESGPGGEIAIFVNGPRWSDDVHGKLAMVLRVITKNFFPEADVEVFMQPFSRSSGFWTSHEEPISANSSGSPYLSMRIGDYFTPGRCEFAGIDSKTRTRIIHGCMNHRREGKEIPIVTVGELLSLGEKRFLKTSNVGRKCIDAVQKMFMMDGIGVF